MSAMRFVEALLQEVLGYTHNLVRRSDVANCSSEER